MKRIFVSHAAQNKTVANKFVRLILEAGIGVPTEAIFFSSRAGSIPAGKYFVPFIRDQLTDASFVISLITPQYRTRPFCVAELGAAWAFVPDGFVPILHDVKHEEMDGVLHGMQALTLSARTSLNELRKQVTSALTLREKDHNQWEEERDEFLAKLAEFEAEDVKLRTDDPANNSRMLERNDAPVDAARTPDVHPRWGTKQVTGSEFESAELYIRNVGDCRVQLESVTLLWHVTGGPDLERTAHIPDPILLPNQELKTHLRVTYEAAATACRAAGLPHPKHIREAPIHGEVVVRTVSRPDGVKKTFKFPYERTK